jgi:hypothetical protein
MSTVLAEEQAESQRAVGFEDLVAILLSPSILRCSPPRHYAIECRGWSWLENRLDKSA